MKPQLADSLVMAGLARELNQVLAGGTVRRVLPMSKQAVALDVVSGKGQQYLLLDWQVGAARAHLVAAPKPISEETSFQGALRRQLREATVLGLSQRGFDRLLVVELANLGGLGAREQGMLILEATGKQANCLLVVRGDDEIAAVARPTPRRDDLYRTLAVGARYYPPPGHDKLDPRSADAEALRVAVGRSDKPLRAALRDAVAGLSNILLSEVCLRAELSAEESVTDLPRDWPERWASAMADVVLKAEEGRAWMYHDDDDQPALVYPVRLRQEDQEPEETASLSEGLALVGQRIEEREEGRRLRADLLRELRAEVERKRRVLERRREELRAATNAEQWRLWGELLVANLHSIGDAQPGGEVELVDYYSPDQRTVRIPLLPGRSAQATAEVYFRRHKRDQRAMDRLPNLITQAERRLRAAEEKLQQVEESEGLEELRKARGEDWDSRRGRASRRTGSEGPKVGRTVAPSGHVVLYGRSSAENDSVVRLARPSDIWLHARGVGGAHVLIRTEGAPNKVPHETLLWAAELAGRMSNYRSDGIADVDYTLARYVHKPRRSPPGFVTYTHQKTLRLTLREERK